MHLLQQCAIEKIHMVYVNLPNESRRQLSFYLAAEEYVARELPPNDYFFMWQVEPTVIFGRNQLLESEVDVDYCRRNGISMFRRKSGGGCVYADLSNIMFSYITPDSNVNFTFNRYMLMVEHVLRKLGLDARTTGRNDILIDGKKVSGNAFYHLHNRSIVHGTMLYDTDVEKMVRATTPSDIKLKSKGVESVRQHVTTLNRYLDISIDEFLQFVRVNMCDSEILLAGDALERIEQIEKEYHTPEFIYGHNPAYSVCRSVRIEGVGELQLKLNIKNGVVRKATLSGDYFHVDDRVDAMLEQLQNVVYEESALVNAVKDVDPSSVIMNLTKEKLEKLIKTFFDYGE